jgi:transcriptional antiterminator NusG
MKQFYIANVSTGQEAATKELLEKRIKEEGHSTKFGRILIPTENVVATKKGARVITSKRVAPAYLMVEMENDIELFTFMRTVNGIFKILGNPPKPLSKTETAQLLTWIVAPPRTQKNMKRGDSVQITDGPFNGFVGAIQDINSKKARISITIFGKETIIAIDPLALAKIC